MKIFVCHRDNPKELNEFLRECASFKQRFIKNDPMATRDLASAFPADLKGDVSTVKLVRALLDDLPLDKGADNTNFLRETEMVNLMARVAYFKHNPRYEESESDDVDMPVCEDMQVCEDGGAGVYGDRDALMARYEGWDPTSKVWTDLKDDSLPDIATMTKKFRSTPGKKSAKGYVCKGMMGHHHSFQTKRETPVAMFSRVSSCDNRFRLDFSDSSAQFTQWCQRKIGANCVPVLDDANDTGTRGGPFVQFRVAHNKAMRDWDPEIMTEHTVPAVVPPRIQRTRPLFARRDRDTIH